MKPVSGGRRQCAEALLLLDPQLLAGARGRDAAEQPGVVLLLVEHRDEPVVQLQAPGAEDLAAAAVVEQGLLGVEHRLADAPALGEGLVEGPHEALGGLDQDAVAHGDDAGDADLEQGGGDRVGGCLGLGGLAGLEEDQRDAVVGEQRADLVRIDGAVAAVVEPV